MRRVDAIDCCDGQVASSAGFSRRLLNRRLSTGRLAVSKANGQGHTRCTCIKWDGNLGMVTRSDPIQD